jgi:hypothetical protein
MSAVEFQHPSGLRISRHLTELQLIAAMPEIAVSSRDMNTGWVWYKLPVFSDTDVMVAISLAFNAGVLELIDLSDASPRFGTNWDEWSEEKERARAVSIGNWLRKQGFSAEGQVWSGYDAKSGCGGATVRFIRKNGA